MKQQLLQEALEEVREAWERKNEAHSKAAEAAKINYGYYLNCEAELRRTRDEFEETMRKVFDEDTRRLFKPRA